MSDNARYYDGVEVKVTYSANEPNIVGETGTIKGCGIFRCNDYWYDVEIDGNTYNLCESQLFYI